MASYVYSEYFQASVSFGGKALVANDSVVSGVPDTTHANGGPPRAEVTPSVLDPSNELSHQAVESM